MVVELQHIHDDEMISLSFDDRYVSDYDKIIQWCMIEFAVDFQRWRYYDKCRFELYLYFRDEADAIACKLRWM